MANDLRVRLYARDSAAGALMLDQLTIAGTTPYAPFTLYAISSRELVNGVHLVTRWGPAGP